MERVAEILQFWFGDGSDPEHERRWFAQDAGFDQACRTGFLADHQRAAGGELDNWKDSPLSALALILLLDQFPRNIFRGTPRAFATDSKALATSKDVVARGFDLALPPVRRSFIYLPFQHSENLGDQQESVRLFRKLAAEHPATAGYVEYAEHHMDVIRRFGRFPHRNAVLGRASTSEETEFLQRPT
jgi:uncharacterized protein (DUF924 family)